MLQVIYECVFVICFILVYLLVFDETIVCVNEFSSINQKVIVIPVEIEID